MVACIVFGRCVWVALAISMGDAILLRVTQDRQVCLLYGVVLLRKSQANADRETDSQILLPRYSAIRGIPTLVQITTLHAVSAG